MQVKNILLYHTADKKHNVSVYFDKGTFWLTQKALASLFGVNVPAISKHLRNVFDSNELDENSVISKMETTAEDGKNYQTKFYRLEAILAVGSQHSHQKQHPINDQQYPHHTLNARDCGFVKEFLTEIGTDKCEENPYDQM